MKQFLGFGVPLIAAGLLLALVPTTLLPVCPVHEGAAPMRCHWTGDVLVGYGVLIAVLGVIFFSCRSTAARGGVAWSALAATVSAMLVPTRLIGVCPAPSMPCHSGAYPGAMIVLSLAAAVCLATLLYVRHQVKSGIGK